MLKNWYKKVKFLVLKKCKNFGVKMQKFSCKKSPPLEYSLFPKCQPQNFLLKISDFEILRFENLRFEIIRLKLSEVFGI